MEIEKLPNNYSFIFTFRCFQKIKRIGFSVVKVQLVPYKCKIIKLCYAKNVRLKRQHKMLLKKLLTLTCSVTV